MKRDLKTKRYLKTNFPNKTLITVITVVFNGEKHLEKTIQSVINQTYCNLEYNIIDGDSKDGTLRIIKKYENQIDYWISERDYGIFDAMNKGAELANGDLVYYLNAGDVFWDNYVVENIAKIYYSFESSIYNLISGNVMLYDEDNNRIGTAVNNGINIPHQGVFLKSDILRKYKFNNKLTIYGDSDLWWRIFSGNDFKPFYTDLIVSKFKTDGVGSHPDYIWRRFIESIIIFSGRKNYLPILRRFCLSLVGYTIYKLGGTRLYNKIFVSNLYNYMKKRPE